MTSGRLSNHKEDLELEKRLDFRDYECYAYQNTLVSSSRHTTKDRQNKNYYNILCENLPAHLSGFVLFFWLAPTPLTSHSPCVFN